MAKKKKKQARAKAQEKASGGGPAGGAIMDICYEMQGNDYVVKVTGTGATAPAVYGYLMKDPPTGSAVISNVTVPLPNSNYEVEFRFQIPPINDYRVIVMIGNLQPDDDVNTPRGRLVPAPRVSILSPVRDAIWYFLRRGVRKNPERVVNRLLLSATVFIETPTYKLSTATTVFLCGFSVRSSSCGSSYRKTTLPDT